MIQQQETHACAFYFCRQFAPRIRHQSEVTERDWENAVQGLDIRLDRYVHKVCTSYNLSMVLLLLCKTGK